MSEEVSLHEGMLDRLMRHLRDPLATPASEDQILAAERSLGWRLPDGYRQFLRRVNGYAGWITEEFFGRLYGTDDLVKTREWRRESDDRPELVEFGGNGGGEGFFFDTSTSGPTVLMISYVSDWREDALWHGDSFSDFVDRILQGWSPFK